MAAAQIAETLIEELRFRQSRRLSGSVGMSDAVMESLYSQDNEMMHRICRRILHVVPILILSFPHVLAEELVFDSQGFESEALNAPPSGWKPFHGNSTPSVKLFSLGAMGSKRSLIGKRSDSGGWTSLSRTFEAPQKRVMIEFSFAFAKSDGRSLNVWSHEHCGTDASQLNLCIQNGALMQFDGRTRTWETITKEIEPSVDLHKPVWHRLRALVDSKQPGIDYWVSEPNDAQFPDKPLTKHAYRTNLPIAAIDLVSGERIARDAWYLIDDLKVTGGEDLPSPHEVPPLADQVKLWTGPEIAADPEQIPFAAGVEHSTIHGATEDGYRFLHGAAIVEHKGVMYANWANSPTNENGPHETLQGRRSRDGGTNWSDIEVVGPGFEGAERHSHGILFVHKHKVWTICSRFGVGDSGQRFPGLMAEAFVLNDALDRWDSRGIVMHNCWPYDEPVRMADGNLITGGQDKDGLPVVAISHGDDVTNWDTIRIPFDPRLKPSFAETTVWAYGNSVMAIIRGGGGVVWVSRSKDNGRTWSIAAPSNLPMPRAKAYLSKLSTGQLYLLSNFRNRDTLVISVSKPGELTFSHMLRIRHGKSVPPRFPGKAKSKQWSYPYGYEHNGRLFVVYSIGKEDCGLSTIPIESLMLPQN